MHAKGLSFLNLNMTQIPLCDCGRVKMVCLPLQEPVEHRTLGHHNKDV